MADYATAAPGIHLEEFTPAGPISGAGTSVAALIGTPTTLPAAADLGKASGFSSWNAYRDRLGGFKAGLNLPIAVKGFFDNGGSICWIVRASTATRSHATLEDQNAAGAKPVLVVRARQEGTDGDKITVTIAPLRDGGDGGYVTGAVTAKGEKFGLGAGGECERVKGAL